MALSLRLLDKVSEGPRQSVGISSKLLRCGRWRNLLVGLDAKIERTRVYRMLANEHSKKKSGQVIQPQMENHQTRGGENPYQIGSIWKRRRRRAR